MQENNSFDKIISSWRQLSGEQTEISTISMSGDSQPYKKKEEEGDLLVPDKAKMLATVNVGTTMAVADASYDTTGLNKLEEKLGYMSHEMDNHKDATEERNNKASESDKESLNPDESTNNFANIKLGSEIGDKVDSAYLGPRSPGKTQVQPPEKEDDCIVNCLYYTLQCCDCVIM